MEAISRLAMTARHSPVDWAVACRSKPGESECGDRHIIVPFDGGVLMAVVDALGHGDDAAAAAEAVEHALRNSPADPVISQVRRCHDALRGRRGAVMSIARYQEGPGILSWLGIGNVEGILLNAPGALGKPRVRLIATNGVVGDSLPDVRAEELDVSAGALLVFATDGIEPGFVDVIDDTRNPQDLANEALLKHGKPTDDALVLAVRIHPTLAR